MKKAIILFTILAFCVNSYYVFADKKEKEALYLSALTERNLSKKFEKLEEYFTKYGKKKKNLTSIFFITVVDTCLQLKKYDKAEEYADRALKFKKMKKSEKIKIHLATASIALYSKKDVEKAMAIADEVIAKAKKLKDLTPQELQYEYIGPAGRLKIAALDVESKTLEGTQKALKRSLEMYKKDKSSDSAQFVFHFAKRLYIDFNKTEEAFAAMEVICASPNVKPAHLEQVGLWYNDAGFTGKAKDKMLLAYKLKKTTKRAYYIGRFAYESSIDEAMTYLAEAAVLGYDDFAQRSKTLLKKIYYEEKAKEMTEEEKEQGFQKLLEEAKERVK